MLNDTNSGPMKLPRVLDLGAAADLLAAMRTRLQAAPHLHIDASEVETLTLPCIQILLAARRSCTGMALEQPSPAFIGAFEDLGLNSAELCKVSATEPQHQNIDAEPAGDADGPIVQLEQSMAKRILTIDDSKTIRDMLMLILAEAGFDVLQAVDGQDGLDMLGKEQVDVVITDINMPRMDGYEVIRQMRSNSAHKTTPILVLTTESEADKRNLARVAGATGWMVKPFDPDRLIATINKVAP